MPRIKIKCPNCERVLRGATTDMIGDMAVCPKCRNEFEIKRDLDVKVKRINIDIHRNDFQKLTFPKACFRCGNIEKLDSVLVLETKFIVRALFKPWNMLSLLFMFIAAIFCGVLGELIGIDLIWLWVLIYGLVSVSLQLVAKKSCRSVELPYCTNCKKTMEIRGVIESIISVVFVISITAIMFLQIRSGNREGFPDWLAYICSFCFLFVFFGYGWLHRYDPPMDIRKQGSVTSIDIPNSSTGRQFVEINKGIIMTTSEANS